MTDSTGVDDLESHLDEHRRRLDEHEDTLAGAKERFDVVGTSDGGSRATGGIASSATGVGAAGLLAALGPAVGTGTAQSPSADAQVEVGTGGRPVGADDSDVSSDDYPVPRALDRATQLEPRT